MYLTSANDRSLGRFALGLIAEILANTPLLGKIKWAKTVPARENQSLYRVEFLNDASAVRTRATDATTVTDDQSTLTSEDITTEQKYSSFVTGQQFFDSSNGRHQAEIIKQRARVFSDGIEQQLSRQVIQEAGVYAGANDRWIGEGSTALTYADITAAKTQLFNDNVMRGAQDPTDLIYTVEQENIVLNLTQFQTASTIGLLGEGVPRVGNPVGDLYGFTPTKSNLLVSGLPAALTADLNDAAFGSGDTSLAFDTQSPAAATYSAIVSSDNDVFRPGQVIQFAASAEYILITAVTYASATTGTLTIKRGHWGSTPAAETDNTAINLVASQTGLFIQPEKAVVGVVAEQSSFNDQRGLKVTKTSADGNFSISVLNEAVPGQNGAFRIMISTQIGFAVYRDLFCLPFVKST